MDAPEKIAIGPYRALDAWRGVAALLVVMVHACLPVIAGPYPSLARVPLYAVSLWGGLGVQFFFVISGYCIATAASRPRPALQFLRSRIHRIYPPYFFASLLAVVLSAAVVVLGSRLGLKNSALGQAHFFSQDARYYFAALTLTQVPLRVTPVLVVFWSLCYEVAFYGIVGAWLWFCQAILGPRFLWVGLNCLTLACLGWLIAAPATCPFPLNLWPQFGLGVALFALLARPDDWANRGLFGLCVGLMAAFAALHSFDGGLGHPSSRVQSLVCAGFALTLYALHRYDDRLMGCRPVRLLAAVGTFSYSLYLTHLLALGVVSQIGKRVDLSEHAYWVSFLAQIVAAIVFARVFYVFGERPFLNARKPKPVPQVVPAPLAAVLKD